MVVVGSDTISGFIFLSVCRSETTESESSSRFVKGVDGGGRVRPPPLDPFFLKCLRSEATESESSSGFVKGGGWWWSGPTTTSGCRARSPQQL